MLTYVMEVAKILLEEVLKKKKISKYKFAQMLGVQQPAVFRFFREDYDPRLSTIEKWAKVLKVDIQELVKLK